MSLVVVEFSVANTFLSGNVPTEIGLAKNLREFVIFAGVSRELQSIH
jgi:hypothetical protein